MNKRIKTIECGKPFAGMAFLFLILLCSLNSFAQSSSKYIRTTVTPAGQLHFIKPIEFNSPGSNSFVIDITVTQTGNTVDSAVANFTFTTHASEPRLDSIQINGDGKILPGLVLSNYYVEKKGRDWISRNGVRLTPENLKILLASKNPIASVFPRGEKIPVQFTATNDWQKMAEIATVIFFQ